LLSLGLVIATGSPAGAAMFVVTTTADTGTGSLRKAIDDANMNVNVVDDIVFAIPNPPFTIKPMSPLPTITDPVTIDGYTQMGTSENTVAVGTNAVLLIEIDGSMAGDTDGILIEHITNVGASTTIRGLIINRFANNLRAGIRINDYGKNFIEGNFIGTDASGTAARPNHDGITTEFLAAGNHIGGTDFAARNLISGNANRGIVLDTNDNIVEGNLIGTDRTGAVALGNGAGIVLFSFAADNVIGGLGLFNPAKNTIAGNVSGGVIIGTGSLRNDLLGNHIGVGADGLTILGNGPSSGVQVGGEFTRIINNAIMGNATGISINADNTVVQANTIGLPNRGNTATGVSIVNASDNLIGGNLAEANFIAGNGGVGVQVVEVGGTADRNGILANSIFLNGGLGIELLNGANNNQPAPQLTSATGANRVEGSLSAAPLTTYMIQFFANEFCDPSGFGEGETFLGSLSAGTDGAGQLTFDATFSSTPGKPFITATATDPINNTSQFSNCVLNRAAIISPAPALSPAAIGVALLLLIGIAGAAMRRTDKRKAC
jgi:hypothetical protein